MRRWRTRRRIGPVMRVIVLCAALGGLLPGCGDERPGTVPQEEMKTKPAIAEVIRANTDRLMKIEGVVGIYEGLLGNGEHCITVIVKSDRPELTKEIPRELGGYPVRLEVGEEFRPMR